MREIRAVEKPREELHDLPFAELGVLGTDVSHPPPFWPAEIEKLLAIAPKYGPEVPLPPGLSLDPSWMFVPGGV